MPMPPPTAMTLESVPIADGTRRRSNSSRMMPKETGKTAPPSPWITRPAIITPMSGASADTRLPAAIAPRTTSRVFSLPIMSPTRPMIGVATEAESSQAMRTQETPAWLVCRACWTVGSTGLISDCSIANELVLTESKAKVTAALERRAVGAS